jgi:photosystem II stability/assembly factor-like uncharacterized protein
MQKRPPARRPRRVTVGPLIESFGGFSLRTRVFSLVIGAGALVVLSGCNTGDPMVRFLVGGKGTVFKTTDGGATWSTLSTGADGNLRAGTAFDGSEACVVGDAGTVRYTVNGGSTWQDGGGWTSSNLNAVDGGPMNTLPFARKQAALAGSGHGNSWPAASANFVPSNFGLAIAAGDGGLVALTINGCSSGGDAWSTTWPTRNNMHGAALLVPEGPPIAVAVGDRGTIVTVPFSDSLAVAPSGTTANLNAVTPVVSSLWTVVPTPTPALVAAGVTSPHTTGPLPAFFVAVGDHGTVLTTSDPSAAVWAPATTTGTTANLRGVAVDLNGNGWAVGDHGAVIHSTDGGYNWSTIPGPATTLSLVSISDVFADTGSGLVDHLLVAASNGSAWTSDNGGTTWVARNVGAKKGLAAAI